MGLLRALQNFRESSLTAQVSSQCEYLECDGGGARVEGNVIATKFNMVPGTLAAAELRGCGDMISERKQNLFSPNVTQSLRRHQTSDIFIEPDTS